MPVTAWKVVVPVALVLLAGCAGKGQITAGGITAVRTACPQVEVPAHTGDVTLFTPATSHDASAIDLVATMTDVRGACNDAAEQVATTISFQVNAIRTHTEAARDVTLPFYVAVVQGGTAVVAKRTSQVSLHFDAGQARATTAGQATANVLRSAATLPEDVRKELTKPRKAGQEDAAIDPLTTPKVKQAVLRATFEALVGFQLTDDQLKYNATR